VLGVIGVRGNSGTEVGGWSSAVRRCPRDVVTGLGRRDLGAVANLEVALAGGAALLAGTVPATAATLGLSP
jgi:hypothetical protein